MCSRRLSIQGKCLINAEEHSDSCSTGVFIKKTYSEHSSLVILNHLAGLEYTADKDLVYISSKNEFLYRFIPQHDIENYRE